MLVSQIMKKDCCVVKHNDLIEVAAKEMKEKHAGTALVFEGGAVSGVITEIDMAKALAADPSNTDLSQPDDGNRCRYLSDVKIEMLLNGMRF